MLQFEIRYIFFLIGVELFTATLLLVSAVQQSGSVTYTYIRFFGFPLYLGHHRSLSRVSSAMHRFSFYPLRLTFHILKTEF